MILLVAYSALNPLAYCGDLVFKVFRLGFRRCCSVVSRRNAADGGRQSQECHRHVPFSEYEIMKSNGITLGGPGTLAQQLQELDAQSRIMCGLPASTNCSQYVCDQ